MKDWIPLINKLVWPAIISILLLAFRGQVSELYTISIDRIKSGGSFEIGGLIKLGNIATHTDIRELGIDDLSIYAVGGQAGVTRKGSRSALIRLQRELDASPQKSINTLLVPDTIQAYSVPLIKEYISTLGLNFVVYQEGAKFSGWIAAAHFVAQLPADREIIDFNRLKSIKGVSKHSVKPEASAKGVLQRMQSLHIASLPVVDTDGKWLFFINRGDILARLMTSLILEKDAG